MYASALRNRQNSRLRKSATLVGQDLVWIPEVQASIDQFGERYLERVFTPQELQDCWTAQGWRVEQLAARFAAKEAVMKLLRPQNNTVILWRDIEVKRQINGYAYLALHHSASQRARAHKLGPLSLSMTHDRDYASAIVISKS